MEPITWLAAATALGQSFISIVPEMIKIVAERRKKSSDEDNTRLQNKRLEIEQELEQLKNKLQQEKLQYPSLPISQNNLQVSELVPDNERKRWQEIYYQSFHHQKKLEQELAIYNRQVQLEIADYQRQTALQLAEVNKLFENWPLRLVPLQILEKSQKQQHVPLHIFLSPPTIQFEQFSQSLENFPDIALKLEDELGDFLDRHYPFQSETRPAEFVGGAWNSKKSRREASIKALYSLLKSEPSLVLESEIINQYELSLRIGYWGLGQETYCYQNITKLSYREILCESAKNRAKTWQKTRDILIKQGKTQEELNKSFLDDDDHGWRTN